MPGRVVKRLSGGEIVEDSLLRFVLYGAMALVAAVYLLKPYQDPDFFWHLKTGEWIWAHRALPGSDPFNFTNHAFPEADQRFTLRAYWLSQLCYYAVYSLLGMPGILALKVVIAMLTVAALLVLRRGDTTVHAALVLAVLPALFLYSWDRPQAFSFLLFTGLIALLERDLTSPSARTGWQSYLPVPLLMLLWANLHGGHAIGQITIVVFIAVEGLKFLHPRLQPAGRAPYLRLLISGVTGLAASLANPNTYHALPQALHQQPTWFQNADYAPSLTFFHGTPQGAIIWGALAVAVVSLLLSFARPNLTWIVLTAGICAQGLAHVRYLPFLMINVVFVASAALSARPLRRWSRPLISAAALGIALHAAENEYSIYKQARFTAEVSADVYPVKAADFLQANRCRGNLFNNYTWGGYLLWRLAPERKVFVDGRGLNPRSTLEASVVVMAISREGETIPTWKAVLQNHGVGVILIPRVEGYGAEAFEDAEPLRKALREDPEWAAVFADAISIVYLKNIPEHYGLIQRYGMPKHLL